MSGLSEDQIAKRQKLQNGSSGGTTSKLQLPPEFKELETIHFRLNSYFTFLSSRKHVITTLDLLKEPVEKSIKRKLEIIDVARIACLIPNDIVFDYFDENQFVLEDKQFTWGQGFQQKDSDIFELKEEDTEEYKSSQQLLVFEFIDGNLAKSKTKPEYKGQVRVPVYKPESMKKLITKRDKKFSNSIREFLSKCETMNISDPWKYLTKRAQSYVPKKIEFSDPVDDMVKSSLNKSENENEHRISIIDFLEELKKSKIYHDQISSDGEFYIPEREASFEELPFELSPQLAYALDQTKHIKKFYSHQAEALTELSAGKHVIVTTSTSSGKSLIYQVPVIRELEKNPNATALYVFPTKALAQDQKRSLQELITFIGSLKDLKVEAYDGDTEKKDRESIRYNASVIFTNPDTIHASMLPNHNGWRRFLINLKYIVIDELHMYKGLFGSHVALIMRRLRRVCSFLGNNDVRFISCSATLKCPLDHMSHIFGLQKDEISHIDEDGSPSGVKYLVTWNPPLLDPSDPLAGRHNFIGETAKVIVELLKHNIRTIVFCVVRKVCELLMKEVRHALKAIERQDLVNDVMSYRGGYSPADRRKIEHQMFHGNLKVIISTNALELGMDIGSLDAVVMCGFPISIANFHQQSGRAGRRNNDSLSLLVGSGDPVNQHFMKHPEELMEMEYPDLILDFDNVLVLEGHLQCAAFEIPFSKNLQEEAQFFGDLKKLEKIADERLDFDVTDNRYHCNSRFLPWPPANVSIRAIEQDMYAVVDITNGRNAVIEEIEASRTSFTLYDGGIFIHQGLPYLIREFNPDERYAKVERVNVDWTTSQRDFTDVDPTEIELIRSLKGPSDVPIYFGKIETTIVVFGFFKMDRTNKILDAIEVHNPSVVIKSKGLWVDIPTKALELIKMKSLSAAAGIHAAQHAIMNILPLYIVTGTDEIQTECKAPEKEFAKRETKRKRPARLIFYDNKGGQWGSGLASKAFEHIDEILEQALNTILECDCEWGCPQCVAAAFCKENSLVLSKPAAVIIIATVLGKEIALETIPNGPEPNMPTIEIETTVPTSEVGFVKFSKDVEIIDVKKAEKPLGPLPPKADEVAMKSITNLNENKASEQTEKETESIPKERSENAEDNGPNIIKSETESSIPEKEI
ncbi:hypothetical protein B5S28_g464 [[Candida] boidinii]|nr:hypothetical protein B5S28_g464 [[Candida] boidinii]